MVTEILISSDLSDGMLPDGSKPLPEPIMTFSQLDTLEQLMNQITKFLPQIDFENVICNMFDIFRDLNCVHIGAVFMHCGMCIDCAHLATSPVGNQYLLPI